MARACGMKVEEFGFGFPPRVFGIRRGSTLYSINWIPIGWIRQNKRRMAMIDMQRTAFLPRKFGSVFGARRWSRDEFSRRYFVVDRVYDRTSVDH